MREQRRTTVEDPTTTHARLTAAALAEHASACRIADAFLVDGTRPDPETAPSDLLLARNGDERKATIGAETADEREFTSFTALRGYVRRVLVKSMTVRREGWTVPHPVNALITPDTARLLLRTGNPVVDIVARIGMNGELNTPALRYEDANHDTRVFDHEKHQLDARGTRYIAELFKT